MTPAGRGGRRTPSERLRARSVFAAALLLFLIIGIARVGDFADQWWLLLLPVALFLGPARALRRPDGQQPQGQQDSTPWS
ncbi:MAG: hypothetical protein M3313_09125 [Actinomycetota bacterium]|nr:hypothetical protein [Actinomycetota bacterium]